MSILEMYVVFGLHELLLSMQYIVLFILQPTPESSLQLSAFPTVDCAVHVLYVYAVPPAGAVPDIFVVGVVMS